MSDSLQTWLKKLDRSPKDVVGLDLGASRIKCVRLRKTNNQISLVAADILPPFQLPENFADGYVPPPVVLPKPLLASYGALVVPSELAVMKILNFPGEFTPETEAQILPHMGIDNPDLFRVSYKLLVPGHARSESRVLAAAYPNRFAALAPRLFPAGPPAPCSLEIAGLASLSALLAQPEMAAATDIVGSLEIETQSAVFALLYKGLPIIIRKFNFGVDSVIAKIRQGLDVSPQVAFNIIATGSIDVSHWVADAAQSFIKQLLVSRDFVERRENSRISRFFICGSGARIQPLRKEIEQAFDLDFRDWNPIAGISQAPDAISNSAKGEEYRLAAAAGAALAILEGA